MDHARQPVEPSAELYAELLDVALAAAEGAGALLDQGRPEHLTVAATKTSAVDVVTEMDIAAEQLIVRLLAERRPHDSILGEEGAAAEGTSGVRWTVDPLDGTVNYLYGLPSWCVSIAADVDGVPTIGVVEIPARGERMHAVRGAGAFLDGRPLQVRPAPPMDRALIATGFGYRPERRARQAEVLNHLLPRVRDIRRGGSAAIDLCDVAAGRLDGYYERGLQPWDYAAGALIAAEAGALVGGRAGTAPGPDLTLAAPAGLFEPLQEALDQLGAWRD
ncbi:inositol monophosphatase family protein [Kitasatospora sp. NPDC088783]|uniref:inositol monophosphatase family protein n=1 Tax=Kitasatospora sp. NPDC088783 TaxID=3364077 RepID=UPI0038258D2A